MKDKSLYKSKGHSFLLLKPRNTRLKRTVTDTSIWRQTSIIKDNQILQTSRESTCGEDADISEPVSLAAAALNSAACSDVPVLLTWGTDASPFTASPTAGDRPGLWVATVDAPLVGGTPLVCGLSTFPCGLKVTWGLGGKLKAHDWEFGAKITPLGGLTMRDDDVLVGEWITCVVVNRGLTCRWGGVWFIAACGDVMFATRETGVLNCKSLCAVLLVLLLASRGPSKEIVTPSLGDESWDVDLFVSSVFIASPFDRLTDLSVWLSTLKCLKGLLRSSGGMSGFFFRLPGPLCDR